jgi:hypothetical protein
MEPAEIERLKRFRHTLPESINSTVSSFKIIAHQSEK